MNNFGFDQLTVGLQNTHNLGASDVFDLTNTVRISQDNTNLGGSQTLLGQLANVLVDFIRSDLQPAGGSSLVGEGTLGDTLTVI